MLMLPKHKVFVSCDAEHDQEYRNNFEQLLGIRNDVLVSQSTPIGDVGQNLQLEALHKKIRDDYLGDSNVTVVLIGAETWKFRHVDWEIGFSIRQSVFHPRSGLLGILLPTYNFPSPNQYDPYTLPPKLQFNIQCGFAKIHTWSDNPQDIFGWLEDAFRRRVGVEPDNSHQFFANDQTEETWQQPVATEPGV